MRVEPSSTTPASALWLQFAAPLRSFVARRAPRELEPEDVLQDVFVRIQEQLPNLRDADRVDAWIFQIARNVIADAYRLRTRREALADRSEREPAAQPPDDDEPGGERALTSCLVSMITRLPEPYREAILLTELCGMTQADAAGRVGVSLSGMKSRVQRGREHLKRVIGGTCRVAIDVRGGVMECDPLRPSACSRDSMGMSNTNEVTSPSTTTTTAAGAAAEAKPSGCCGGPAPSDSSACCALDAEVKSSGGAGCGCGAKPATATATATPAKKGCC